MRNIVKIRPLRYVKSMNKIVVASYSQWRSIKVTSLNEYNCYPGGDRFILNIIDDYKEMNIDSIVHDHKGNPLFFYNIQPEDIFITDYCSGETYSIVRQNYERHAFIDPHRNSIAYCHAEGFDCEGVPLLSHYTMDYIIRMGRGNIFDFKTTSDKFEPLTVDIVMKWFLWFLKGINNWTPYQEK